MKTQAPLPRVMRLPAVIRETGLSRPTIYNRVKAGTFPAPRALGEKSSGWRGEEVQAWIDSLPLSTIAPPARGATA